MTQHFTNTMDLSGIEFGTYKKKTETKAVRVEGPFTCITVDGNLVRCDDGYLCFDSAGFPYPAEREVFERSYEPISQEPQPLTE